MDAKLAGHHGRNAVRHKSSAAPRGMSNFFGRGDSYSSRTRLCMAFRAWRSLMDRLASARRQVRMVVRRSDSTLLKVYFQRLRVSVTRTVANRTDVALRMSDSRLQASTKRSLDQQQELHDLKRRFEVLWLKFAALRDRSGELQQTVDAYASPMVFDFRKPLRNSRTGAVVRNGTVRFRCHEGAASESKGYEDLFFDLEHDSASTVAAAPQPLFRTGSGDASDATAAPQRSHYAIRVDDAAAQTGTTDEHLAYINTAVMAAARAAQKERHRREAQGIAAHASLLDTVADKLADEFEEYEGDGCNAALKGCWAALSEMREAGGRNECVVASNFDAHASFELSSWRELANRPTLLVAAAAAMTSSAVVRQTLRVETDDGSDDVGCTYRVLHAMGVMQRVPHAALAPLRDGTVDEEALQLLALRLRMYATLKTALDAEAQKRAATSKTVRCVKEMPALVELVDQRAGPLHNETAALAPVLVWVQSLFETSVEGVDVTNVNEDLGDGLSLLYVVVHKWCSMEEPLRMSWALADESRKEVADWLLAAAETERCHVAAVVTQDLQHATPGAKALLLCAIHAVAQRRRQGRPSQASTPLTSPRGTDRSDPFQPSSSVSYAFSPSSTNGKGRNRLGSTVSVPALPWAAAGVMLRMQPPARFGVRLSAVASKMQLPALYRAAAGAWVTGLQPAFVRLSLIDDAVFAHGAEDAALALSGPRCVDWVAPALHQLLDGAPIAAVQLQTTRAFLLTIANDEACSVDAAIAKEQSKAYGKWWTTLPDGYGTEWQRASAVRVSPGMALHATSAAEFLVRCAAAAHSYLGEQGTPRSVADCLEGLLVALLRAVAADDGITAALCARPQDAVALLHKDRREDLSAIFTRHAATATSGWALVDLHLMRRPDFVALVVAWWERCAERERGEIDPVAHWEPLGLSCEPSAAVVGRCFDCALACFPSDPLTNDAVLAPPKKEVRGASFGRAAAASTKAATAEKTAQADVGGLLAASGSIGFAGFTCAMAAVVRVVFPVPWLRTADALDRMLLDAPSTETQ
jgi:hypothetical protein